MSARNELIVLLAMQEHGYKGEPYIDAKTFRDWIKEGRVVRKGEKAFCAVPVVKECKVKPEGKVKDEAATRTYLKSAYLFHREQTDVMTTKETA